MRGLRYSPSKVHAEKLDESARKGNLYSAKKPDLFLGGRADILACTLLQFSTAGAAGDKAHETSCTAQSACLGKVEVLNGGWRIKERIAPPPFLPHQLWRCTFHPHLGRGASAATAASLLPLYLLQQGSSRHPRLCSCFISIARENPALSESPFITWEAPCSPSHGLKGEMK